MIENYKGIESTVIRANGEETNIKIHLYSQVTTILLDNEPIFSTDTSHIKEISELILKRLEGA